MTRPAKIGITVALVVAVASYLAITYLRRPQPSFQEAVSFVRSVHAFVEAQSQPGRALPSSVQMRELVNAGYITADTARRFDGSEVTFPPSPSEPQPLDRAMQQVLISLRLPDGRKTIMTADGSIHLSAR